VSVGNDVAVRVERISKSFALWASPLAPLRCSVTQLAHSLAKPFPGVQQKLQARVQHLRRDFHALNEISFEIKKGESWGFIGVNGSGKSTLLKMISGNLTPTQGRIEVDGKVAILDYSSGLHSSFSGRENIYLKGAILGLSRREIDRKMASITEFADIGDFIDQPVKIYSSGMTARLGFAILAHVDADIIITDEALAVGDAAFVQKCTRHIRKFLEHGTFLFVSHSTNDVMSLCNRAIWLEHGSMRMIGSARDVCLSYIASSEQVVSQSYLAERKPPAASTQQKLTGEQLAQIRQHVYTPGSESDSNRREAVYAVEEKLLKADAMFDEAQGVGGGRIIAVQLLNDEEKSLSTVWSGEKVVLRVHVMAERTIQQPIVGFQMINPIGLSLFADNTSDVTRAESLELGQGEIMAADFRFRVPLLPPGDYAFRTGFADGTEHNNALLDCNDALIISCITSTTRHGLVGVPLLGISMEKTTQQACCLT
jgi:lipopolysaccharide transport system ATP-binding protein